MLVCTEHSHTKPARSDHCDSSCAALDRANQHPKPDAGGSVSFPVQPAQVAGKDAGTASLGILAKSVDQKDRETREKADKRRAFRSARYVLQRHAASLLPRERVSKCRYVIQTKERGADVMKSDTGNAFYSGLQTCGSPWLCPVCSSKISEVRRTELNDALAWARGLGVVPVMLTLTHRHGAGDVLSANLAAMKKAKQRLRQRREWRAVKPMIAGTVTATEVTHGVAAGWHVHFHEVVFVEADSEADAVALFADMGNVWVRCLQGCGLDGIEERAWQVQGAASVGEYMAKWGAAEELALGERKKGNRGGLTPWQLLTASKDGDKAASARWVEYAKAFKGSRQLVWSPGLKAAVGLTDTDDTEAAAEEPPAPEKVANITYETWTHDRPRRSAARHRRARILDAAEIGGAAAVAVVIVDDGTDGTPDDCADVFEHEPEEPALGAGDEVEKVKHNGNPIFGGLPPENTDEHPAQTLAPSPCCAGNEGGQRSREVMR